MLKKLMMISVSVLALQVSAFAQNIVPAPDHFPFEIDDVATAQAPWKVGEETSKARCIDEQSGCFRVFWGVTPQGQRVLQEFYNDGKTPLTDIFLLKKTLSWDDIRNLDEQGNAVLILDSNLTARYTNGSKYVELIMGKDEVQMSQWDEDGKLIESMTLPLPAIEQE